LKDFKKGTDGGAGNLDRLGAVGGAEIEDAGKITVDAEGGPEFEGGGGAAGDKAAGEVDEGSGGAVEEGGFVGDEGVAVAVDGHGGAGLIAGGRGVDLELVPLGH